MWGFVLIIVAVFVEGAWSQCQPRDYGKGSVVCVCNVSYCDYLGDLDPAPHGQVLVFESNKAGLRFAKTTGQFRAPSDPPQSQDDTLTIIVDTSKTYQKIFGFGGAFTDAAGININSLPDNMQENIIQSYYSDKGLSYNIGRVPMASCDFSVRQYTYADTPGDFSLANFSLAEEDFQLKIPHVKRALQISKHPVWMFASPWSGPAWMKNNGRLNHGGWLIGHPGGKYYKTWADYFVRFLQEYERNGIEFWGVTAENEPTAGFDPNYAFQCMGFTPESQRDFIKLDLGPALEKAGYGPDKLALMIMDDQRLFLPLWAKVVLSDADAAKYVAGVAVHWYTDSVTNASRLDETHDAFPDKFILATEACMGDKPWIKEKVELGSWDRAENYSHDILEDLQHWVTGWVDWNLALDRQGGPNWVQNFVDSPIIVNADAQEFYKQPMYYALAHFTKFLSRGSLRVASRDDGGNVRRLEYGAFKTPQGSTVVVVLNPTNAERSVQVKEASSGSSYARTLTPRSINTFVWW
ncbi:hypothetical protein V5799_021680 [Amblyomma americanum]|uniref:Glucosylceramidase n=1 Tax=Amblyomma americanum TaxID=6943 RepID=A0AAQ4FMQ0_AMBAM